MHREERTMTTIYLIRHAEAEGNVFRRIHGQYDSCVTPNGYRQIAALAQRFAGIPVDAVYASDLKRTCLTATAIYRQKGLPLHRDARFREVGLGPWEDTPFGELERRYPAQLHAFSHDSYHWYVEGAECFLQYAHRFLAGLEDVVRRHEGQSIAIFSHGMVLRGALIELFFPGQDEGVSHSENTAVTELHWENDSYELISLNDAYAPDAGAFDARPPELVARQPLSGFQYVVSRRRPGGCSPAGRARLPADGAGRPRSHRHAARYPRRDGRHAPSGRR